MWEELKEREGKGGEEKGLEHCVLSKLDMETDEKLRFDLKEILFSLLSVLAPYDPMKWLLLCNGVLSATGQKEGGGGIMDFGGSGAGGGASDQSTKPEDPDEDMAQFTTGEEDQSGKTLIIPRWPTKVFAVECSRKIYQVCRSDPSHFDLKLAQGKKESSGGEGERERERERRKERKEWGEGKRGRDGERERGREDHVIGEGKWMGSRRCFSDKMTLMGVCVYTHVYIIILLHQFTL